MVVGGVDELPSGPAVPETGGKDLDPKMIDHTADGHQQQVKSQHVQMHRDDEKDDREDQGLDKTFPGMK